MSIRRKWLKIVMLLLLAGASMSGAMNPQEIEEQMRIMNANQVTATDEDHKGDGDTDVPDGAASDGSKSETRTT